MKATIKIGIIEISFEGTVDELFDLIKRLLKEFPFLAARSLLVGTKRMKTC